jgi:hypothetical protein
MASWDERTAHAIERYEDGQRRLPSDPDERQRQLTRMGNAAWAAGLSLLMAGRDDEARKWLLGAAATYRQSWPDAPAGSWGRPIGALKARLIAGDVDGADDDAHWALDAGAVESESPIGRYAAALALLALERNGEARQVAEALRARDDFPAEVADALVALGTGDRGSYEVAARALLADFEGRDSFLEDVPVADTVLALQALATARGLSIPLASSMLPSA